MLLAGQPYRPSRTRTSARDFRQHSKLPSCRCMQAVLLFWLTAVQLGAANSPTDGGIGQWRVGRATTGPWSINQGSCGYGNIHPDDPLGWNVAALPDVDPAYTDSCGKCFEVQCMPSVVSDMYGGSFDRSAACYDSHSSLVVRVVDTCPCTYPPDAYSNKRCCGDMAHLELSIWSWERLADPKWGVIGIKFRPVPCDYQPSKVAAMAAKPTPAPEMQPGKPIARDWPEFWPSSINPTTIYDGALQLGWSEQLSGSARAATSLDALNSRPGGSPLCISFQPGGAYSLSAPAGSFQGRIALILWLYMGDNSQDGVNALMRRNLQVLVAGPYGACPAVSLLDVQPTGFKPTCAQCTTYWWRFEIFLGRFAGSVVDAPQFFKGCAGNDAGIISLLSIRNQQSSPVQACLDHVQLV